MLKITDLLYRVVVRIMSMKNIAGYFEALNKCYDSGDQFWKHCQDTCVSIRLIGHYKVECLLSANEK